jgi:hypothetical protein
MKPSNPILFLALFSLLAVAPQAKDLVPSKPADLSTFQHLGDLSLGMTKPGIEAKIFAAQGKFSGASTLLGEVTYNYSLPTLAPSPTPRPTKIPYPGSSNTLPGLSLAPAEHSSLEVVFKDGKAVRLSLFGAPTQHDYSLGALRLGDPPEKALRVLGKPGKILPLPGPARVDWHYAPSPIFLEFYEHGGLCNIKIARTLSDFTPPQPFPSHFKTRVATDRMKDLGPLSQGLLTDYWVQFLRGLNTQVIVPTWLPDGFYPLKLEPGTPEEGQKYELRYSSVSNGKKGLEIIVDTGDDFPLGIPDLYDPPLGQEIDRNEDLKMDLGLLGECPVWVFSLKPSSYSYLKAGWNQVKGRKERVWVQGENLTNQEATSIFKSLRLIE